MSLTPAVCCVNDVQGLQKDPTFHPSLWGDFFLKYKPPTAPKVTLMLASEQRCIKILINKNDQYLLVQCSVDT
jgi:hypothetical protein